MKTLTDTEMMTIAGGVTEGPNGEGCTDLGNLPGHPTVNDGSDEPLGPIAAGPASAT